MFVWVYRYRYWDADRQEHADSRDLFTIDAIRAGLGIAIMESARRVRADQVDENGRLKEGALSAASGG